MNNEPENQMPVQGVSLEELVEHDGESLIDATKSIDLVQNVQISMDVVVGAAKLSVGELFDLKNGSVISIDRDASAPLDLVFDGKVVARGYLVAAGENFGIQIANSES
ncbi:MAG: FliM/FliN family flagellar motor switch protein [Candidatus Sedimenticola sp. (ex Thyasira tokunagai)]